MRRFHKAIAKGFRVAVVSNVFDIESNPIGLECKFEDLKNNRQTSIHTQESKQGEVFMPGMRIVGICVENMKEHKFPPKRLKSQYCHHGQISAMKYPSFLVRDANNNVMKFKYLSVVIEAKNDSSIAQFQHLKLSLKFKNKTSQQLQCGLKYVAIVELAIYVPANGAEYLKCHIKEVKNKLFLPLRFDNVAFATSFQKQFEPHLISWRRRIDFYFDFAGRKNHIFFKHALMATLKNCDINQIAESLFTELHKEFGGEKLSIPRHRHRPDIGGLWNCFDIAQDYYQHNK